jgi:hypothetical protein
VLVRRNDRGLGVVNGDRGVVTGVDPELGRLAVDLGGRPVSLPRAFLEQPTRHGGRSLMHGYALTVHLAQGMTCDRTFVLAGDQLTREAGYVALSRGRQSNRLYVLDSPESERDEFAPAGPSRQDPVRALVESLGRSRRQTMATVLASAEPELALLAERRSELEHERATAMQERTALEREHPAWFRAGARARHAAAIERAHEAADLACEQLAAIESRELAVRTRLHREQRRLTPEVVRLRDRAVGRVLGR